MMVRPDGKASRNRKHKIYSIRPNRIIIPQGNFKISPLRGINSAQSVLPIGKFLPIFNHKLMTPEISGIHYVKTLEGLGLGGLELQ